MLKAILFDLDDTLLGNDIAAFIPHYSQILVDHARAYMEPDRFQQVLMSATQAMVANEGSASSNRELFWARFSELSGLDAAELEPFFDRFYSNEFDSLASQTEVRPEAAGLVKTCFDSGLKVVIATNPMFPRTAIEKRLAWAGVPVSRFHYDLVTSYDNMHATKPSPAYYREILDRLKCKPNAAMMVGDDWRNDIEPASGLGLATFWINGKDMAPPDPDLLSGFGSLEELAAKVSNGWLLTL